MICENDFKSVRVVGLNKSIRIEVLDDLHEFGALDKTVTLSQAEDILSAQHA